MKSCHLTSSSSSSLPSLFCLLRCLSAGLHLVLPGSLPQVSSCLPAFSLRQSSGKTSLMAETLGDDVRSCGLVILTQQNKVVVYVGRVVFITTTKIGSCLFSKSTRKCDVIPAVVHLPVTSWEGGFLDPQCHSCSPISKCLWQAAARAVCMYSVEIGGVENVGPIAQNILHKCHRELHARRIVTAQQGYPGSYPGLYFLSHLLVKWKKDDFV